MSDQKPSEAFAQFIGWISLFVISVLISGYVVMKAWEWFIVPLGVSAISIPHAMGITSITRYLATPVQTKKDSSPINVERLLYSILIPLFFLGVCWIIHKFM